MKQSIMVLGVFALVACGNAAVKYTPAPNAPKLAPSSELTTSDKAPPDGAADLGKLHVEMAYETNGACDDRLAREAKAIGANYLQITEHRSDVVARCTGEAFHLAAAGGK